jgi:hypothetical protein
MNTSQIVSQQQIPLEGATLEQIKQLLEQITKGKKLKDLFAGGNNGQNEKDKGQQEESEEEI